MADIKQNYKGSEKLVDSSNLYENLKNFDDRRQKKLDKELRKKVTIPEHYALCKSSTPNALKIVETVSDSLTEITLADVQSKVLPNDYHSYKLNEYVVLVADGRSKKSDGISLYYAAVELQNRGCYIGYNLDGGGSTTLYFNGEVLNNPSDIIGERRISDILYFKEN